MPVPLTSVARTLNVPATPAPTSPWVDVHAYTDAEWDAFALADSQNAGVI